MTVQPLPRRQQEVLKATVHHYVDTIEPVGSRSLVQRFNLQASPATVRSAMGALEQRGLLTQPHTSAGRVPSPSGYRHYVDCLLPRPGSAIHHLDQELAQLSLRWAALDDLLTQVARRLTDFTGLMSLITQPQRQKPRLQAVRCVRSEDRLLVMLVEDSSQARHLNLRLPHGAAEQVDAMERWANSQLNDQGQLNWNCVPHQLLTCSKVLRDALDSHQEQPQAQSKPALFHGVSRLVAEPEFSDSSKLRPLLELMDHSPCAVVPDELIPAQGVWIGREHPQNALHNCSVVKATYSCAGQGQGHVALIGPMRMAYATALAAVTSVAQSLERLLA